MTPYAFRSLAALLLIIIAAAQVVIAAAALFPPIYPAAPSNAVGCHTDSDCEGVEPAAVRV